MTVVHGRTKTAVRRHVAPGKAVPLYPEAVRFADRYDFAFDVLAACRPTGRGRVGRRALIVRDHVLPGRPFPSVEEKDAAFTTWVLRRQAHAQGDLPADHQRAGGPRPQGPQTRRGLLLTRPRAIRRSVYDVEESPTDGPS
ncbi:hypothetical protein ACFY8O_24885 [Streptomyces argenteolus]|uniref:Uncharacterized protein n=1 Tax=Streptomyces argenteolus TaxID=67274 RepID=A0ABW6XBL0_9ACTN